MSYSTPCTIRPPTAWHRRVGPYFSIWSSTAEDVSIKIEAPCVISGVHLAHRLYDFWNATVKEILALPLLQPVASTHIVTSGFLITKASTRGACWVTQSIVTDICVAKILVNPLAYGADIRHGDLEDAAIHQLCHLLHPHHDEQFVLATEMLRQQLRTHNQEF